MDLNKVKELLGSMSEEQFVQFINENKLEKIDLISLILDIYNQLLMEKQQYKQTFEYSQKYSLMEQQFTKLTDNFENKIKLVEEFYFQQFNRLKDVLNLQNALIREQKEKLYNLYFQFGQLYILMQDQKNDVFKCLSAQKEMRENEKLCEIEIKYQKLKESSEQLNKFRPQYENENYINIENFNEEQCKYVEEMIISLKNYISKQISIFKEINVKNESEIQLQGCFDHNLKSKEETLEKILNQLKYYRKKNQNFQLVIKQKEDQICALRTEQEVHDNIFKTKILIIDNGNRNIQEKINLGIQEQQ